jgi:class 3 adenylate cyclase/alpha-beta hydrolase superfamily lysophospholipase
MPAPGDICYARTNDGIDIAYTAFGEGLALLFAPGFVSHLDLMWDFPAFKAMLPLAKSYRLIVLDKRGTGLSDRSLGFGSLEQRTEDIRAVLDHASAEQAILYGVSESGPLCTYFAATQPERVRALVLYGTLARFDPTLPLPNGRGGTRARTVEEWIDWIGSEWGKGEVYQLFMSSPPDATAVKRVLARYERSACTPQMSREIMTRNTEMNVESLLGSIAVPTLIMHCKGDPVVHVEHGRRLAAGIPGARYIELEGDFHGSWRHEDIVSMGIPLARFLEEVVGTAAPVARARGEREVATVLFTDIVGSTERAGQIGDAAWRALLDEHDAVAARAVQSAGGSIVKTTGDGVLATFAGPSHAMAAVRQLQESAVLLGVSIRAGVHTGEIERRADDIGGIGVHIAARLANMAGGGEVLVSRTTRDLAVGSKIEFDDRGMHTLKGVPEPWQVFAARC